MAAHLHDISAQPGELALNAEELVSGFEDEIAATTLNQRSDTRPARA